MEAPNYLVNNRHNHLNNNKVKNYYETIFPKVELHYLVVVDLAVINNKILNRHSSNHNRHKDFLVHSNQILNKHKPLVFSEMLQVSQAKGFLENPLLEHNHNKHSKQQGSLEINNNNHNNKVARAYLALHNKILEEIYLDNNNNQLEDNSNQLEEGYLEEISQLGGCYLELHNKFKQVLLEHNNLNNKLEEDYLGLKGKLNNNQEDGLINKILNNHNNQ